MSTMLDLSKRPGILSDDWTEVKPIIRELCGLIPGTYHTYPGGRVCGLCTYEPSLCELLLSEKNKGNRAEIKGNTRYLIGVMQRGEWQDGNGETIIFDWEGSFRDGAHRLRAGIASGRTFSSFTILGVDPKAFTSMDQGAKRGTAHVLGIEGEVMTTTLAGALDDLLGFFQSGKLWTHHNVRPAPTEHLQILQDNPGIRNSVRYVRGRDVSAAGFPSAAQTATLHYLFGRVDPAKRDEMFQGMVKMCMPLGDPKWNAPRAMRGYFSGESRKLLQIREGEYVQLMIKTWNYFLAEKNTKRIRIRKEEDYPRILGWAYRDDGVPICPEKELGSLDMV